ncbi:MAG: GNAT family N-acetyltransferase [Dehalococcoidia bacterium]
MPMFKLRERRMAPERTLKAHWFDRWECALDDALLALPEGETCSHDLFRLLVNTPSPAQKRVALVTDGDDPVALIALRRRNLHWDLITEGVVSAALPPCLPGREIEALSALGLFVWVNEWEAPVPASKRVHFVQYEAVYRVSTRIDLDAYWRERHHARDLRKARNRCARLGEVSFEVDQPGAAEWTIDRWEETWADHPWSETVAAPDIRVAASYLMSRGQYHSFRLLIDGRPVAGMNASVRGKALVIANSGREPEFDKAGTGVRRDELFYRWCAQSPYERVDLGGGFEYKARWAETDGVRARFSVAPPHLVMARQGLIVARRMKDFVSPKSRVVDDHGEFESTRWM